MITSLDQGFVEADDAYCQMLLLTPAELRKRDIRSITHPADWTHNGVLLHSLVEYGTPFWIRKRYVRDDGSLVWVLNHVTRTVGAGGARRIAAATFILPCGLSGGEGADRERLAGQTTMLKMLLQ